MTDDEFRETVARIYEPSSYSASDVTRRLRCAFKTETGKFMYISKQDFFDRMEDVGYVADHKGRFSL